MHNGQKLYTIAEGVLETYTSQAKHHRIITKEILERRLSAILTNSKKIWHNDLISVYDFGGFTMEITEASNLINKIYWRYDTNYTHSGSRVRKKLEKAFASFGLNKKGYELLSLGDLTTDDNRTTAQEVV